MVTASVRPGPAPAAHARASTAPAAASSWRTLDHLNARSHVPIVDGARVSSNNSGGGAGAGPVDVVDAVAAREHRAAHRDRPRAAKRRARTRGQLHPRIDQSGVAGAAPG